jgi:hypothetical protein
MTWRAILGKVSEGTGWRRVTIVYTDDVSQKVAKEYQVANLTDDFVKQVARQEIARLDEVALGGGKLTISEGEDIDLVPPVVVPPKPAPSAAFFSAYQELKSLQRGEAAGMPIDAARMADLLATCKTLYLSDYGMML